MLIGEFGTGKNVFLELVAKGDAGDQSIECIDENVDGTQDEMMEKFFGKDGLVQNHPNSLIHFDLLQNALDWPVFLDTLHRLVRQKTLYRTDGKVIKGLDVRVVGGATVDLEREIRERGAGSAKYLYDYLATNQLAKTKKLTDQLDRLQNILAEILATQVLDAQSQISENDVMSIENISEEELIRLKEYNWPDGFYEIVRFVRTSLIDKKWMGDSLEIIPEEKLKVFICHSSTDLDKVNQVHRWLIDHNVEPWMSTENLLPGHEWEFEIKKAISKTDVVLICLTKNAIRKEGFVQTEIRKAIDIAMSKPEGVIYLIPLRLEQCEPPLRIEEFQYVDFFDSGGQNKLLKALRNRATTLGRAPIGPRHQFEKK
jgi:DNA-binding NtrC family response regulator